MKSRLSLTIMLLILVSTLVISQENLIVNVYNRTATSLNGKWHYIVDPYENGFYNYRYQTFDSFNNPGNGAYFTNAKPSSKSDLIEYNFDEAPLIDVPGDWNSQKEDLFYYEGSVWYQRTFDYAKNEKSNRVYLYFGAVNYEADVYLNGKKLGKHIGGFTPFNYEVTSLIKEKDNFVILKVDNKRKKEAVPTLNTDWWNYGGITRDVKIVEVPQNYIVDYFIQLDQSDNNLIKGFVQLEGNDVSGKEITVAISELGIKKSLMTNADGKVDININVKDLIYWSPENPKLYKVVVKSDEDEIVDEIGFRTIKTEGTSILLNGEDTFLRGICIHEENPIRQGRARSQADAEMLLGWAKELGCNFVRLAHYPHNEYMIRTADKMGLLVWEEIPVYWTIDWENRETYQNAANQLKSVIKRDKNRAATIVWSMANETPNSEARVTFLTNLVNATRELDPTRLVSAALEVGTVEGKPYWKNIHDPFAEVVDILSFNEYIGWYDGLPEKCSKIEWHIDQQKPVVISEFGGGAKYGYHADSLTRWSEEYQEYLYKESIKMLTRIDQLSGMTPWILSDFRSPRRPLANIQDGWNRKGLIDNEGNKKKAYYILQKFYKDKAEGEK